MSKITGTFLPLGSIVKLTKEEEDKNYMIVARAIFKNPDETIVPRYKVSTHPYGVVPTQELLLVEDAEIQEVLFTGFENQEDIDFLDSMLERMANFVPRPVEEKKPELTEEERLQQDPFYKFRG